MGNNQRSKDPYLWEEMKTAGKYGLILGSIRYGPNYLFPKAKKAVKAASKTRVGKYVIEGAKRLHAAPGAKGAIVRGATRVAPMVGRTASGIGTGLYYIGGAIAGKELLDYATKPQEHQWRTREHTRRFYSTPERARETRLIRQRRKKIGVPEFPKSYSETPRDVFLFERQYGLRPGGADIAGYGRRKRK